MVPQLVTVRYRRAGGRRRRLFVPVVPVLLVLSPLLLAVLAAVVTCLATRISPMGALRGTGRLLWALPGTRFEIEDDHTVFQVSVR